MKETQLVPATELKRLLEGSYEHLVSVLGNAVVGASKALLGEGTASLLATFSDEVVVTDGERRFVRAAFKQDASGDFVFENIRSVEVPVITERRIPAFLRKEMADAVQMWFEGKKGEAFAQVGALLPLIEDKNLVTEAQVVEGAIAAVTSERAWKRLMVEHQARVDKVLGDAKAEIQAKRLPTKFSALTSENYSTEKLESFREVVTDNLLRLCSHIEQQIEAVAGTGARLVALPREGLAAQDAASLQMLAYFSEDLLQHSHSLFDVVSEATDSIVSVPLLGRVYDAVADEVCSLQIAHEFVAKVVNSLGAQ